MDPLSLIFTGTAGFIFLCLLVTLHAWAAVKLWWLGRRPRPPMPRWLCRSTAILAATLVAAAITAAAWIARH
ncbi:MAG: hypothetical protein H0X45_05840 [Planctomycetes bacterium]|nr:hypothetical protein [Planctomycetota bacterium]